MARPEAAIAPARPDGFRELADPRLQGFFLSLSLDWSWLVADDIDMVSASRADGARNLLPFFVSALWNTGADWGTGRGTYSSEVRMLVGDSTMGDVTTTVAGSGGTGGISGDDWPL